MELNLAYRIVGNGYVITNHGVDWVVQDTFIPYPKATMEESAHAHIDEIIAEFEAAKRDAITLPILQQQIVDQQGQIEDLTLLLAELING